MYAYLIISIFLFSSLNSKTCTWFILKSEKFAISSEIFKISMLQYLYISTQY